MRKLLAEQTGTVEGETLFIPAEPDMTGALGAALWAESLEKN
jgi:activator of 2-hydroxyglutaryl-CoA dehydratase